jgi:magnesium chelatase accessory protein
MTVDPPNDWPMRADARRVRARHDWWVVEHGSGPEVLLLHGAGASGHSFRTLVPAMAGYRCLVPDLPGQGFSLPGSRGRFGIAPMAEDVAGLCKAAGWKPRFVIGHSAGVPLALQLSTLMPLERVIGINAALGQFEGAAGFLFPLLARALAATPFVPGVVSRLWGNPLKVRQLIEGTGSHLDEAGIAHYVTLVKRSAHVDGTLAMMAAWRVDRLMAAAPSLVVPTLLIATGGDQVVPPKVSHEAARMLPRAEVLEVPKLGHLAHEEDAAAILQAVGDRLA